MLGCKKMQPSALPIPDLIRGGMVRALLLVSYISV
jgi:hypothetical protein